MTDPKGRTIADLVAACDTMAMRARAERAERNRRGQLDVRNMTPAPPTLDDEGERDEVVAAVVIDMDRYQAGGAR